MRTLLIAAAAVALLQGCATGGSPPTSRVSGLDGSHVVTVPGHGNACSGVVCTGLGAQWSSATPDHALLVVYVFNDVRAITGASLSVGGRVHRLTQVGVPTTFAPYGAATRESRKAFAVPLGLVRELAQADRAWLRVETPAGYLEDPVVDSGREGRSLGALRRFLSSVDAAN